MAGSVAQPLVSVVTPVYNGASFLAECMESVLRQSYENFEYLVVNNCSSDQTLEIAMSHAARDSRVRVHTGERFVGVIENHNIAFSLISQASKYCKVVSADDFLFPDCLRQLVEVAEGDPTVGFVGSYQLSGSIVRWQGFEYPRAVYSGHELCRRVFLGIDRQFGFGSPTSLLYRADLVRSSSHFYPNPSPHADTSACFRDLQHSKYGFAYQVLSYERVHPETQSTRSAELNRYKSAWLNDLIHYGPSYLSREELRRELRKTVNEYYEYLGSSLLKFKDRGFWEYHRSRLKELGYPIRPHRILRGLGARSARAIINPRETFGKIMAAIAESRSSSV